MRWQWTSSTVVLLVTGIGMTFAMARSSYQLMTVTSSVPVADGLIATVALVGLGAMLAGLAEPQDGKEF